MRRWLLAALLLLGCGRDDPRRAAAIDGAPPRPPADAAPPDAPPGPPPIAWVNPARCAVPCTFDPGPALVRIDDDGKLAPAGAHRVDASVVEPLGRLLAAAAAAGYQVRVESAFRSYEEQAELFRTTRQIGRAARPGHSEHQLGTAIDLDLPTKHAVAWLAAHATDHGFVVSYPPDKHRITGYRPENWHVRHVGAELAAELARSGATLEELLQAHPERGRSSDCGDCPVEASRAPCDGLGAGGRCRGDVLEWCYDGTVAVVHCGAMHRSCKPTGDGDRHDCS
jgi:D-alanyl-D-alanine carboxypeptidase